MSKSDKSITTNTVLKPNPSEPKQKPLFTQEQIVEQVRNFIYAYQHGLVKLNPKERRIPYENPAMELIYLSHIDTETKTKSESSEITLRRRIIDLISIVLGQQQRQQMKNVIRKC